MSCRGRSSNEYLKVEMNDVLGMHKLYSFADLSDETDACLLRQQKVIADHTVEQLTTVDATTTTTTHIVNTITLLHPKADQRNINSSTYYMYNVKCSGVPSKNLHSPFNTTTSAASRRKCSPSSIFNLRQFYGITQYRRRPSLLYI